MEGLEHSEGRVEHRCERERVEHPVHRVERGEKNQIFSPVHFTPFVCLQYHHALFLYTAADWELWMIMNVFV